MKKNPATVITAVSLIILIFAAAVAAQKKRPAVKTKPKPIIFAVLNDGQTLEPIGEIDKGELVATANGGDEPKALTNFTATYYKPKTVYNLIFGGAKNGAVAVASYDAKSDCGKNLATVTTQSVKAKLKGFVMALATNETPAKTASGVRRLPTAVERAEIETLVRAEMVKQGVTANAAKNLKYYNLTALDVDSDGKAEMVGSFWAETSAKERNLLFFIADKDADGKYQFGYSDYAKVTPKELMSGEMKDLDELGGELLLDALEYNGDATAEIFTIKKAFEGNNFQVYSRQDGKWTKVFEGYNYHCAY
ncbi:MAG: hypothetical protein LH614_08610 [Pyrinomonadaceae bacterium]|nr:hypothetical protein [Pyrinomonadaceae bacterium]